MTVAPHHEVFLCIIEDNLQRLASSNPTRLHVLNIDNSIMALLYYCERDEAIWTAAEDLRTVVQQVMSGGGLEEAHTAFLAFRQSLEESQPSSVAKLLGHTGDDTSADWEAGICPIPARDQPAPLSSRV